MMDNDVTSCPLCWRNVLAWQLTQCDKCQIECCVYCSKQFPEPELYIHCRPCEESRKLNNPKVRFIYINPAIVATHTIQWQKIYGFAKAMERGDQFPPVKAAYNEHGQIVVRNGAHRTHAARLTGLALLIRIKQRKQPERIAIDTETFPSPGKPSKIVIHIRGNAKLRTGEPIFQSGDGRHYLVSRQGKLEEIGDIVRIGEGMGRSSCAVPNYCCGEPKQKEDKS